MYQQVPSSKKIIWTVHGDSTNIPSDQYGEELVIALDLFCIYF